jgi:sporulation protein YlmC with PRC-barrel domain
MLKFTDLFGIPVVDENGVVAGRVCDLSLDLSRGRVTALLLDTHAFPSGRVIPFTRIRALCAEAIRVASVGEVPAPARQNLRGTETLRASRLRNRRVVSLGGDDLGSVVDMVINSAGLVVGLDVLTAWPGGLQTMTSLPFTTEIVFGDIVVIPNRLVAAFDNPFTRILRS